MTKQEAIKQKEMNIILIENFKSAIAELDAIIYAPEPDPRIGKLFKFWDNDPTWWTIKEFKKETVRGFVDMFGVYWLHCCPVTLADLEGKIYQEPRKTRYDWKNIDKDTRFIAKDFHGTTCAFASRPNSFYNIDFSTLEERPEGV